MLLRPAGAGPTIVDLIFSRWYPRATLKATTATLTPASEASRYLPSWFLGQPAYFLAAQARVLHLFALALMLSASSVSMGASAFFWREPRLLTLSALCSIQFFVALMIAQHLRRIPRTHLSSHNFIAVAVSSCGLLVILAISRVYYSRAFLLSFFSLEFTWMFVAAWALSMGQSLRFGVISGGIADEVVRIKKILWKPLVESTLPQDIDGVVLDLHRPLSSEQIRLLAECSMRQVPIYHAALIQEYLTGRVSLDHLSRGLVDGLQPSSAYRVVKRVIDLFLVILLLPVALPIALITALVIRMDSPGPVLFRQERVGRGGKRFQMVKFRTMQVQANSTASFAKKNDPRITRVGHFLRTFRLDEIPQFWNILKGEMSFIGPRPEQVEFVAKFEQTIPFYTCRHLIKPGLSGWAQVHHGYADSAHTTQDKLEYDLFYVKNASLALDVVTILHTVRTVLTRFGSR